MRSTVMLCAGVVAVLFCTAACNLNLRFPWSHSQDPADSVCINFSVSAFQAGVSRLQDNPAASRDEFRRAAQFLSLTLRSSPALFHNLGNAHLLAGEFPQAILAYRQGLRVDPNHHVLRENLEYARALVSYPASGHGQPERDAWPAWLYQPSPFQAFILAFVLLAGASIFFTRWFVMRRTYLLARAAILLLLALAGGGLWAYLENQMHYDEEYPVAVIAADNVPFLKGNGMSYPRHPDLPTLERGMEARQVAERGDWLQIRFPSGEIGWVRRADAITSE